MFGNWQKVAKVLCSDAPSQDRGKACSKCLSPWNVPIAALTQFQQLSAGLAVHLLCATVILAHTLYDGGRVARSHE